MSDCKVLHFDSLMDEKTIKDKIDVFLKYASYAMAWVYNIETSTMTMTFYSTDAEAVLVAYVYDYKNFYLSQHLIFPEDETLFEMFCSELEMGKADVDAEFRNISDGYEVSWYRFSGHTATAEDGRLKVFGRRFDVSREKSFKAVGKMGQDPLTGLANRDKVKTVIKAELSSLEEGQTATIILLDIDDFHTINEALGSTQGDAILQTVSGLIFTNFMSKDIVGRIAGDQFVIFCKDIGEEKVFDLLSNLSERLKSNVSYPGGKSMSFSAGVAFAPVHGNTYEPLYARADIALFCAKKAGKDTVRVFDGPTMCEVGVGYTLLKMGKFDEDEERIVKNSHKVNKKLFDFAFEELSKNSNVMAALKKIFRETALYYGLDRAFLYEKDSAKDNIALSTVWSKIPEDEEELLNSNIFTAKSWSNIEMLSVDDEKDYLILKNGRGDGIDLFREFIEFKNVPLCSIILPVVEGENMLSMVVFDSFTIHDFKRAEITTLLTIVKLIRSYVLSKQVKYELEKESIINKNVMDAQRLVYYIIDKNTYRIKYVSKYAMEFFDNNYFEYGKHCYEALWNRNEKCERCPVLANLERNMVESYDQDNDTWYTLTASKMEGVESDSDVLICVTDVTEFLNKIRGEDSLTVADSYEKFVVDAAKLILKKKNEYSVGCVGIRSFAKINDKFGYVVGDEILKELALLIKNDLVEEECVCRVKGDDFVVLRKKTSDEFMVALINKYMKVLNEKFKYKCNGWDIQCFAGCYHISEEDQYVNKCIDRALKARNLAMMDKSEEGGFFVYTNEIEEMERREEEVTHMIRDALYEERFRVFFQPKVNVENKSIMGAEALVRMVDREGKFISPGVFIPVAEKNGMVVDIDYEVYKQTFQYMAKWMKEGKKMPLISVNVSRLHLADEELPEKMEDMVKSYGLDTKDVELEITESVFFQDTERLIGMIQRLKDKGFVISMDDFGSGYSTLNFMKNLPVDIIKIDGGFFMNNVMDKKSKAIISAIMQLTQNLEFEAVSEGVETLEQVEFLKEQGGKCVQGYYFYKPMPAEEFEKLI